MENEKILQEIKSEISELRKDFSANQITEKWIPIKSVMNWLQYGPTQMSALLKTNYLTVARIGKRKFVLKESLEKFLEKNKISPSL